MLRSLLALPAFVAVALAQGTAIPVTTLKATPTNAACTGCYVIADVAQVIFADYTVTQTATAVVSNGHGLNGSVVTTSLIQAQGQFSFSQGGGIISGSAVQATYVPLTGTVVTVGGATLTSPTAYNVFTGYTQYQLTANADGSCGTSQVAVQSVNPGFKVQISGANSNELFAAESAFIDSAIPALTCAVGGAVVTTSVPVPASITTTTSTTNGFVRPTPIGVSLSGTGAATTFTSSGSVYILTPTQSVVMGSATAVHPMHFSPLLAAAIFVLPGIAAVLL